MQRKVAIFSIVVALIIVISVSIGTTYSLWTTSVHQASVNSVDVGCFNVTFNDTNFDFGGDISLTNAYPISDVQGKLTQPYKFSITNQCSVAASYQVILETLSSTTMDEKVLDISFNDDATKLYASNVVNGLSEDAKNGMSIFRGYLSAGQTIVHTLRVWINYDVTVETANVQGKTWNGRVVVNSEATFTKPILANKVLSGENVVLDVNTGVNKTIESISCYYGDKNNQDTLGTAIGTSKCQYPLSAEYAKYDVTYTDGTSDTSIVKRLAWYIVKDGRFLANKSDHLHTYDGWYDYYIERTQEDGYVNIIADYSTALEDDGCGWLYGPFNANDYMTVDLDMEYSLNCASNQIGGTGFFIPKNEFNGYMTMMFYTHTGSSSPFSITLPRTHYILDIHNHADYNTTDYTQTMFQIGGQGQCVSNQKIYNLSMQYAE